MTYRNRDLLDLARLAPCCMSCQRPNDGTVVAAHSNMSRDGKGMGIKAADHAVAYVDQACHTIIDQSSRHTRAEREHLWEQAHRRTLAWLFESGHLVVAEEARRPDPPMKVRARVRKSRPIKSNPKIQSRPWGNRRQEKTT